MLSRILPETKRYAEPPRKHAAPASSACLRRGHLGFPLVANPRRRHGTRHEVAYSLEDRLTWFRRELTMEDTHFGGFPARLLPLGRNHPGKIGAPAQTGGFSKWGDLSSRRALARLAPAASSAGSPASRLRKGFRARPCPTSHSPARRRGSPIYYQARPARTSAVTSAAILAATWGVTSAPTWGPIWVATWASILAADRIWGAALTWADSISAGASTWVASISAVGSTSAADS